MPVPPSCKPVAQVQNPVKAPEFAVWTTKMRPATKLRLEQFAQANEFAMKDIVDVALLDYMDNFERMQQQANGEPMEDAAASYTGEDDGD